MDYFEFEKDFKEKIGQLKLQSGDSLQPPIAKVSAPPFGWTIELFVRFQDGMHIRTWENYGKIAGLLDSRRIAWAYHYGPVVTGQEASDGTLVKGACSDPLVLRIDTTTIGPHLHFNAHNPHYKQEDVGGLALESVDSWKFIKAVLKHRHTGKGLDSILGFKIKT